MASRLSPPRPRTTATALTAEFCALCHCLASAFAYHFFTSKLKHIKENQRLPSFLPDLANTPHIINKSTMCRPTNSNALTPATFDEKSFRRIRQRNAAAAVDGTQMPETTQSLTNIHPGTIFYAKLNDVIDAEPVESKSSDERRKSKRNGRSDRTLRPDATGRINNKECHLFAFGALFEKELD